MARIEISLAEYNEKTERIKILEETLVKLTRENQELGEKLQKANEIIEDLAESSLTERIFSWNKIKNQITYGTDS